MLIGKSIPSLAVKDDGSPRWHMAVTGSLNFPKIKWFSHHISHQKNNVLPRTSCWFCLEGFQETCRPCGRAGSSIMWFRRAVKGIQLSTRLKASSEQYVRIKHGSTEKVVQVVAIGLAWTLFYLNSSVFVFTVVTRPILPFLSMVHLSNFWPDVCEYTVHLPNQTIWSSCSAFGALYWPQPVGYRVGLRLDRIEIIHMGRWPCTLDWISQMSLLQLSDHALRWWKPWEFEYNK